MLPFPTSERLAQYLVLPSVGFTASIHPLLQTGTFNRRGELSASSGCGGG